MPALALSATNSELQLALNHVVYWSSLQGLRNGFLFLVLVVASLITEMIDRNIGRAALLVFRRDRVLLARDDALGNLSLGSTADVHRGIVGRRSNRLFRPLVER